MQIIRTNIELENWLKKNKKPAFVPTMGFLHKAHIYLIEKAKKTGNKVLVSIFINPKQFREGEDLSTYPRDEKNDITQLEQAKVDAVFIPEKKEIYPENFSIDLPPLPHKFSILEGKIRHGYFEGIATVLKILFEKIKPSSVHFGIKDYQQTLLVKWLIKYYKYPIHIDISEIIREKDGLALSSRNEYLTKQERKSAVRLSQSLTEAQNLFQKGEQNIKTLKKIITEYLQKDILTSQIDICEILDAQTLEEISIITKPAIILLYVKVGTPRLLDNCILIP